MINGKSKLIPILQDYIENQWEMFHNSAKSPFCWSMKYLHYEDGLTVELDIKHDTLFCLPSIDSLDYLDIAAVSLPIVRPLPGIPQ